ncbi:ABC transporter substrate-binding protein [Bariatricus sp. SGI.154]|uniref:ABC transporter substrate-binding protein n=1 Tax=Bariatricus sp. SGI.154 TaxID=3420549 RepID=UPI003CFBDB98
MRRIKDNKNRWASFALVLLMLLMSIAGCAKGKDHTDDAAETDREASVESDASDINTNESTFERGEIPEIEGLTYEKTLELDYATEFAVYYYQDGYEVIDVYDSARYLVVPEGREAPENLDQDIVVLWKPLDKIYLAATSAMALFDALDSVDAIRLSGTDASGWYIEDAATAMETGDMLFAGKYSEPDYELMVDEGCDIAIESTMILHTPKVQEMIEDIGIPVFIDRSSYETHPLGRTEWIKLYGALMDKDEEAKVFFDEQAKVIEELKGFKNTEKTVAFFYVNTDGSVVVRKADDYIPAMIEIAGGRYAFDDLENTENQSSSVKLTMEEFYAAAVEADYLIYNSSIDNPIDTVDDLLAKSELFAEFKAVKTGNVWCTGRYLYQATDVVGNLIADIHLMLTGGDVGEMHFLYKVDMDSAEEAAEEAKEQEKVGGIGQSEIDLADGTYEIEVDMEGGSGRASISSPAKLTVEDKQGTASIEWSSSNYDYMLVNGKKYLPVNTEGNSVFEIPVLVYDEGMTVIADTTAMSTPHEVEYVLTFHSESLPIGKKNPVPMAAIVVVIVIGAAAVVLMTQKKKMREYGERKNGKGK